MTTRGASSRIGEITRWWAAFSGVLLWFLYLAVQFDLMDAEERRYCARREALGELCNYDHLPLFEFFFVPAFVLLAAYPFSRFAYGVFAPPIDARRLRWSFAGATDATATYPVMPILAVLGLGWSIFSMASIPFAFASWVPVLYWAAWICWFAGAIAASWSRRAGRRDR